jgi:hypothetical protein
MISASVAPFPRFISAMTSAFLLLRSAAGLLAFLARAVFFAREGWPHSAWVEPPISRPHAGNLESN